MRTLKLQHISVEAEEKEVVHDVSLSLAEGEVSILMGPNGCGKSTLVNAVFGHPHYAVTKGKLLLDGKDTLKLRPDEKARRGLFLSLQHLPRVGGTTLATFLHKVHVAATGEASDILEYYLELRERAKELGIRDDLLDRPLTQGLSGGEKKLSELLQLAVLKPRFAVLDEIDSGVDVDAIRTVFAAVEKLRKEGTGFLLISHHPSLLEHVTPTHVHLMAGGKLVRSAGKELAQEVHKNGFCKAIECPLEPGCDAKG
jgi:Fe-S cluster assembly ATP-binding protein